jgi:hypothetical protein
MLTSHNATIPVTQDISPTLRQDPQFGSELFKETKTIADNAKYLYLYLGKIYFFKMWDYHKFFESSNQ